MPLDAYASFIEIYQEKIHDLLSKHPKESPLGIREDKKGNVSVVNVTKSKLETLEDVYR